MISVTKKYSSTPTIFYKLRRPFKTHSDPVVSDVRCYSQPYFDEAAELFHKLGEVGSGDHGSLPVAKYKISVHDLADLAWKQVVYLANFLAWP